VESTICSNNRFGAAPRFNGISVFSPKKIHELANKSFLDRVQQLLVRVIFLPEISDSNKPISRVTLR